MLRLNAFYVMLNNTSCLAPILAASVEEPAGELVEPGSDDLRWGRLEPLLVLDVEQGESHEAGSEGPSPG